MLAYGYDSDMSDKGGKTKLRAGEVAFSYYLNFEAYLPRSLGNGCSVRCSNLPKRERVPTLLPQHEPPMQSLSLYELHCHISDGLC